MGATVRRAIISAMVGLFAAPALAAPIVYEAISPAEVFEILRTEDGAFKLNDSDDDATISGGVGAAPFDIYFYNCDGGGFTAPARADSKCLGFEFRAYFPGYPNDAEIVNAWNNAHHYGALWRDDEEDLALQLNVIVDGGVTEANIKANYRWWLRVMKSIDEFLVE